MASRKVRDLHSVVVRAGIEPPRDVGMRTAAPMWLRPLITAGEWAVYTALWALASDKGSEVSATHQEIADLAWVERSAAANAVRRLEAIGAVVRRGRSSAGTGTLPNSYQMVPDCPESLADRVAGARAARTAQQAARRARHQPAGRLLYCTPVPMPPGIDPAAHVVYYVRRALDGAIKIGRSRTNLRYRLTQLAKDYGEIRLLAVEKDTGLTESARHGQFRALRMPHQGPGGGTEWFRPGAELVSHIEALKAAA